MSQYQAIVTSIGAHVRDQITVPLGIPTLWENQVAAPPGVSLEQVEWLRCSFVWGSSRPEVIQGASGRYRTRAELIVGIFVPLDRGTGRAMELADLIADVFRGAEISDASFETAEIRLAGESGHWFQVNVHCPFFRDEVS